MTTPKEAEQNLDKIPEIYSQRARGYDQAVAWLSLGRV